VRHSPANRNTKANFQREFLYHRDRAPDHPEVVNEKPLVGLDRRTSDLPGYRSETNGYYAAMEAMRTRLVPVVATAPGLPADYVAEVPGRAGQPVRSTGSKGRSWSISRSARQCKRGHSSSLECAKGEAVQPVDYQCSSVSLQSNGFRSDAFTRTGQDYFTCVRSGTSDSEIQGISHSQVDRIIRARSPSPLPKYFLRNIYGLGTPLECCGWIFRPKLNE
jgi:hypothetical protein